MLKPYAIRYFLFANFGQTLIEMLVAVGIAVIVISSMTVAVTTALSNAAFSKNQSLATQYAQEGMELVKNEANSSYQTFSNMLGRYCLSQTCASDISMCNKQSSGNCPTNINYNLFIRQADILSAGSGLSKCVNSIQATISVLWSDGKCQAGAYCHTVSVVSCFSNANVIQTP